MSPNRWFAFGFPPVRGGKFSLFLALGGRRCAWLKISPFSIIFHVSSYCMRYLRKTRNIWYTLLLSGMNLYRTWHMSGRKTSCDHTCSHFDLWQADILSVVRLQSKSRLSWGLIGPRGTAPSWTVRHITKAGVLCVLQRESIERNLFSLFRQLNVFPHNC